MPNMNQDWNVVIVPNGENLLTQHLGISLEGAVEVLGEVLSEYLTQLGRPARLIEPRTQDVLDEEAHAQWLAAGGHLPGVA